MNDGTTLASSWSQAGTDQLCAEANKKSLDYKSGEPDETVVWCEEEDESYFPSDECY